MRTSNINTTLCYIQLEQQFRFYLTRRDDAVDQRALIGRRARRWS
jgi:hypothetical protein